jgi:hypothetical protein
MITSEPKFANTAELEVLTFYNWGCFVGGIDVLERVFFANF